jgi:tetratricopeptide (TPR) repeat protein
MNEKSLNFENLTAILGIAAIGSLLGLIVSLTGRYSDTNVTVVAKFSESIAVTQPLANRPSSNPHRAPAGVVAKTKSPAPIIKKVNAKKVKKHFEQAIAMLHAKKYEYAVKALDEIISMEPYIPEVYVNLGYAYYGMQEFDTALSAFNKAVDLRPAQANAYYGLAEVLEEKKDYAAALGAMRSFIHLAKADNRFITKAKSAIWEWETKLGRKPSITMTPEQAGSRKK